MGPIARFPIPIQPRNPNKVPQGLVCQSDLVERCLVVVAGLPPPSHPATYHRPMAQDTPNNRNHNHNHNLYRPNPLARPGTERHP
jgi:hypothetical protein